jgi:hypothetical protein
MSQAGNVNILTLKLSNNCGTCSALAQPNAVSTKPCRKNRGDVFGAAKKAQWQEGLLPKCNIKGDEKQYGRYGQKLGGAIPSLAGRLLFVSMAVHQTS